MRAQNPRRRLLVPLALALALVGCGAGSTQGTSASAAEFAGTWSVTDIVTDGQALGQEELAAIGDLGLYLTLDEDGDATYEMFGTKVTGTWEATGAGSATLSLDDGSKDSDGTREMSVEDGSLTLRDGEQVMTFERIDPASKVTPEEGAASQGTSVTSETEPVVVSGDDS